MNLERPIRIAGGGPAGLACAIELAKAGQMVEVHERRSRLGGRFDGDHQVFPAFGDEPNGQGLLELLGIRPEDLFWVPLREARFLDGSGQALMARSERPYAYLIRRGPQPGSLDRTLLRRAEELGVELRSASRLDPAKADVVATGARRVDGLALERMFETRAEDRIDVLFDPALTPAGYAYLFVHAGEATLGVAALGGYRRLEEMLEKAARRFAMVEPFDQHRFRSACHGMNFGLPSSAVEDGRLLVGEAGGFQDFLFGLGLRMALLSGHLAARSLLKGEDYDMLWQAKLGARLRASLVDRWIYERAASRGALLPRLRGRDLHEALEELQRDHWTKHLLLPWVRWRRMRKLGSVERPRMVEDRS
jgi:flavin-dependent dehydrogenase